MEARHKADCHLEGVTRGESVINCSFQVRGFPLTMHICSWEQLFLEDVSKCCSHYTVLPVRPSEIQDAGIDN